MNIGNENLPRGLARILAEYQGVEEWKSASGGFEVIVRGKRGFVASWKVDAVEQTLDQPGSLGPLREAMAIDFKSPARSGPDQRRNRGRDRR